MAAPGALRGIAAEGYHALAVDLSSQGPRAVCLARIFGTGLCQTASAFGRAGAQGCLTRSSRQSRSSLD